MLRENSIKLNLSKCEIAKNEVTFLGYRISKEGSQPDPKNVNAVLEMKPPTKVKEVRRFSGFHYFFFTQPFFVTITCPEGSSYKEVTGHLAVRVACSLRSDNLTTFPEKLHHGFTATNVIPVYSLDGLQSLNFTRMRYVTNTLSELTFSNFSELQSAVHDSLPVYLAPYVHYPSMVVPVIIFIIIVSPLWCLVKRVLTFYNHLLANVASSR